MTIELNTIEAVIGSLDHCVDSRWIIPTESWQSSDRRFSRRYDFHRQEYIEPNPALPIEFSTTYGDWREVSASPDAWIIPGYCTGSDYSGNLVEVSNYRTVLETCEAAFPDGEGTDYITYSGGHGTFAIAIRAASLIATEDDDSNWKESIVETITGLSDYPLADESLHSELESESQNEAWEDWARSEFKTALGKHLANSEYEYLNDFARDADWITDDMANSWFYEMADYANEYWINEQGDGSYIDVERVVSQGLTRELKHWPEGARKQDALYQEIVRALDSAATAAMLCGEI